MVACLANCAGEAWWRGVLGGTARTLEAEVEADGSSLRIAKGESFGTGTGFRATRGLPTAAEKLSCTVADSTWTSVVIFCGFEPAAA